MRGGQYSVLASCCVFHYTLFFDWSFTTTNALLKHPQLRTI